MKNKWKKVCSMAVLSAVMVTGLFGCGGNSDAQDSQKCTGGTNHTGQDKQI